VNAAGCDEDAIRAYCRNQIKGRPEV